MSPGYVELFYLVATALFIFSLHWMNDPKTARRGVAAGAAAMLLGVVATWAQPFVVNHGWMVLAVVLGIAVGYPLSRVALTAAPQRTALSHAFGGLAAALVGTAKYYLWLGEGPEELTTFRMVAIIAEVILGCITFTGSLFAAGKLQELKWVPQRAVTYPLQNVFNIGLLLVAIAIGAWLVLNPTAPVAALLFPAIIVIALMFGILLIIPIGGADMPTVIAILNSYAGLAAVAMGFVLENNLLITAGALDGSSGLILSIIMCKAMNRSYLNVLFGAFGSVQQTAPEGAEQGEYKADTPQSAAQIMDDFPQTDVVLVIGANDVVNPAANQDESSPIYGMPIIEASKARTIFAIKRSKNPGFAGIDNALYFDDKTWMLFGDAKHVVGELIKELSGESAIH